MSKLEQMQKLENGKGFQYLVNEGQKILGNPINTFDTDYTLIAHSDVQSDDPLWNELKETGTFSHETQIFFMDECFTDEVANAEVLAVMKSDKLKYDRVLRHIFNGNGIKVANVLMLEHTAFDEDTIDAFNVLAELLTKEISGDEHYIKHGEKHHDKWIRKLIDYDLEEKRLYSPHIQILYNDFMSNLYLAIVDISLSAQWRDKPKELIAFLRQKHSGFKYSVYDKHVIMLISTNYKTFNKKRELSDLPDFFEQENIFVGISSRFDNLFELNKYYAEAASALNAANHRSDRRISVYSNNTDK